MKPSVARVLRENITEQKATVSVMTSHHGNILGV